MLVTVVALNLISVKVFGEMEFWFALIKVAALVIFLVVGTFFVIFGTPTGSEVGFSLISDNGGIFPYGIMPTLVIMQGVIFAYASIELVGTTSGETKDARKVIPKAINTVIWRIALFYVGSVVLLTLLLPHTAYSADGHLLWLCRRRLRRAHHGTGHYHRRHVIAQRGSLLHRPHPALHGSSGLRTPALPYA